MAISLLHISDLHRDLNEEVSNGPLLESLARDIDSYSDRTPSIRRPDLCIVSGDLVYGAPRGTAEFDREIRRQYDQALEFLGGMADRFFAGDRDKVVIVPGNHDVCFDDVISSAQRIDVPADAAERKKLGDELFRPRTKLRWSWGELCFYRIVDDARYDTRLRHFAYAYREFYGGRRQYSDVAGRHFNFFDYPSIGVTVVGLDSCHGNDPFQRRGAFYPDCIAEVTRHLRSPAFAGRFLIGVWHHSLFGGPAQDDYLDAGALQHLIDAGISLGLHGHQHRSEYVQERHRIGRDGRKIVVVSAGTLCAGPKHLNPGEPRSYNVVEIDTEDWQCRVHKRCMTNCDFAYPIWWEGQFLESGQSYVDLAIDSPANERPADMDAQLTIERGERLVGEKQWAEAVQLLRGTPHDSPARPLLAQAVISAGDIGQVFDVLSPPLTSAEAVAFGDLLYENGVPEQIAKFLNLDGVGNSGDVSVREITRRLRERTLR